MKPGKDNEQINMGRRRLLPALGGGLLFTLLPVNAVQAAPAAEEEAYKTLLRPDGTAVRVKLSALRKAKVIRNSLSNGDLREWLTKEGTADQNERNS